MGEQGGPHCNPGMDCGHECLADRASGEFCETKKDPENIPPPPASLSFAQESLTASPAVDHLQCSVENMEHGNSCLTDMDCPVCFTRYDLYRVPKELSCRHSFCAVCVKLLIRNGEGTWLILCPICRAPTTVFGGLVCTLQNQETLMRRLQNPGTRDAAPGVPKPPETALRLESARVAYILDDGQSGNLRTAAMRLVILLMILIIVMIVILQFLYSGIMKWVLGLILGVVVVVTVLLCFHPYFGIGLSRVSNPA